MKFESRKDIVFSFAIIGVCLFLIGITIFNLIDKTFQNEGYWPLLIVLVVVGFLLWIFFWDQL